MHVHTYEMKSDGVTRLMDRYCGAYICFDCNDHEGLARCYCGWASNGGNGMAQLREMGENVEDDYSYDEPYDIDSDVDFNPYTGSYEYFENDSFESDF